MNKFDFMAFGHSPGDSDMFVVSAKDYTAEQAIELCKREYEYKFRDHTGFYGRKVEALKMPTVDDVHKSGCAFRLGIHEWPEGCYTLVGENERGAFPVWVIDFERLQPPKGE